MSDSKPARQAALLAEHPAREHLGGIGHTKFYELIKAGDIHTVKIGRRTFVTQDELDRYVATLAVGASA